MEARRPGLVRLAQRMLCSDEASRTCRPAACSR